MAEHPDHKYINKLLDDLESGDVPRRVMAVRALAKLRARNQLIARILQRVVSRDPDQIVRQEAAAALLKLGLQTRTGFKMAEPPSEGTIQKLLKELRSFDPYRRMAAIKAVAVQQVKDERIVNVLKTMVTEGRRNAVRGYAQAALYTLEHGQLPPDVPWSTTSLPSKPIKQLSRNEKIRDFLIGFIGWWMVNGTVWALVNHNQQGLFFILNIYLLPVNVLLLIILTFVRGWVALGLLTVYAVNFLFALTMGLLLNGVCWIPFYVR